MLIADFEEEIGKRAYRAVLRSFYVRFVARSIGRVCIPETTFKTFELSVRSCLLASDFVDEFVEQKWTEQNNRLSKQPRTKRQMMPIRTSYNKWSVLDWWDVDYRRRNDCRFRTVEVSLHRRLVNS